MKYTTILLLLIATGCKTDTKPDSQIDKSVYAMWDAYVTAHPEYEDAELPESFFFYNNEKDADRLARLVLNGEKKAGSSLYALYEIYDADLPKAGTKQIVTNFNGKAVAIIETTKVDTVAFTKISKAYAQMDMGTAIEPLEKWKEAHWDFFAGIMKESGKEMSEDMPVVCETFAVIWP